MTTESSRVGLRLESITHLYGDREALSGIDLALGAGVTGLLGQNGAGKSTMLSIACGLMQPTRGSVFVEGELSPYNSRQRSAALRKIALVPQEFAFPRRFKLGEFLQYMAWLRGVAKADRGALVQRIASSVGLADRLEDRLGDLSGGMRRRANIAQALLAKPDVLLLDEATTGLDPLQRVEVLNLVQELAEDYTVLMASHIVEDIEHLAQRVVVLDSGRILFDGDTAELARRADGVGGLGRTPLERGFLAIIGAGK